MSASSCSLVFGVFMASLAAACAPGAAGGPAPALAPVSGDGDAGRGEPAGPAGVATAQVRAVETGLASWYGEPFHGRPTASGEIYDQDEMTAAHPSWPLRSLARVTRLETGKSILVRINDRGPFVDDRIVDLSHAAAAELGFVEAGLAEVRLENLGPADAHDRAARSRILTRP
jgi:rare lipoprotein A